MHSATVIRCLDQFFSLCGMPGYTHSDNQTSFSSNDIKKYLTKRGIATSKSSPYHPPGNSQVERYSGVIWKVMRLGLKSRNSGVLVGDYAAGCSSYHSVTPLHGN